MQMVYVPAQKKRILTLSVRFNIMVCIKFIVLAGPTALSVNAQVSFVRNEIARQVVQFLSGAKKPGVSDANASKAAESLATAAIDYPKVSDAARHYIGEYMRGDYSGDRAQNADRVIADIDLFNSAIQYMVNDQKFYPSYTDEAKSNLNSFDLKKVSQSIKDHGNDVTIGGNIKQEWASFAHNPQAKEALRTAHQLGQKVATDLGVEFYAKEIVRYYDQKIAGVAGN